MPPDERDEFGILAALRRYEEELVLERMWDATDLVQLEFLEGMCEVMRRAREIERQYRAILREGQA
jgi:hypothetical protein